MIKNSNVEDLDGLKVTYSESAKAFLVEFLRCLLILPKILELVVSSDSPMRISQSSRELKNRTDSFANSIAKNVESFNNMSSIL